MCISLALYMYALPCCCSHRETLNLFKLFFQFLVCREILTLWDSSNFIQHTPCWNHESLTNIAGQLLRLANWVSLFYQPCVCVCACMWSTLKNWQIPWHTHSVCMRSIVISYDLWLGLSPRPQSLIDRAKSHLASIVHAYLMPCTLGTLAWRHPRVAN